MNFSYKIFEKINFITADLRKVHKKVSFRIWFVWNLINRVQNTGRRKHVRWYIDFILYWWWFNLNHRTTFPYTLIHLSNYLCLYVNNLYLVILFLVLFTNYMLLIAPFLLKRYNRSLIMIYKCTSLKSIEDILSFIHFLFLLFVGLLWHYYIFLQHYTYFFMLWINYHCLYTCISVTKHI